MTFKLRKNRKNHNHLIGSFYRFKTDKASGKSCWKVIRIDGDKIWCIDIHDKDEKEKFISLYNYHQYLAIGQIYVVSS